MPYHPAIGRTKTRAWSLVERPRSIHGPTAQGVGTSMPRSKVILFGALLFTTAAIAIAPLPVRGQFAQYTQPGTVNRGGPEVTREGFEQALEEAPWHLGAVRVDPWIGVRNASWTANPLGASEGTEAEEADFTVSGGAGLRAHLPTGHSVFWTAHVLPEYQWWAEQDQRARLNGRYGVGVFGFLNRMTLEASARRVEQLGVLTAEAPQEINSRQDVFRVANETLLGFATSVFAEVSESRTRAALEAEEAQAAPGFRALDRDERRIRTGLRYRPRDRWTLGLGVEWTEAESVGPGRDLSNSGTAPLVEVLYDGPSFWASGAAEFRSLEAESESGFRDTDTETYSVQVGVDGNRVSPAIYARRNLSLALSEQFSHFTSETFGATVGLQLGYRTDLLAFGELGQNEFVVREGAAPLDRVDDLTSYGAEISFRIGRGFAARLGGYRTEFDSNVPGEDRTLEVLQAGLTLSLGGRGRGSGSDWL